MARQEICKKGFMLKDNSETRHASADVFAATFNFANGKGLSVVLKDLPKEMVVAAAAHGISQKVGDGFAGSAKAVADGDTTDPVAWSIEQAEAVIDNLMNGVWITVREGAGVPSISMLAEAIIAAGAKVGKVLEETKVKERLKDEKVRKGARENAAINAEYTRIRAERATAVADAAVAAASGKEFAF